MEAMRIGILIALMCFSFGFSWGLRIDTDISLELAMRASERAALARGERIGFVEMAPAMYRHEIN